MGAFGDTLGLDLTYQISAILAFIAILFAMYLDKSIKRI